MILHEKEEEFEELVEATSVYFNIPSVYIEKDYWVTYVLKNISNSDYFNTVIFKGGTSLSKAYKLLDRFSEDIDLAIITDDLTGGQIKTLIKNIEKNILDMNFKEVVTPQTSKGSKFRKTVHQYPQFIDGNFGHANENLILELNSFAQPHPFNEKSLSTYIYDFLIIQSQEAQKLIKEYKLEPFNINVLDYRRTFCEKLSAIARASFESDENNSQLKEKIRHFYDIYFLMQEDNIKTFIESTDFIDMIKKVRLDDQEQFNSNDWAQISLHSTKIFKNSQVILDGLKHFYENDFKSLVYSKTIPSIEKIQIEIETLSKILKIKNL